MDDFYTMNQDELDAAYNDFYKEVDSEINRLSIEHRISNACASKLLYLRTRSRWSIEKENELIRLDRNGSLPSVLDGDF